MAIEFDCVGCGQRLRLPTATPGQQARCPQCQTVQDIRLTDTPPAIPNATPFSANAGRSALDEQPPPNPFADRAPSPHLQHQFDNPYAATTSTPAAAGNPFGPAYQLASRGKRFVGAILDGLIYLVACVPGFALMIVGEAQNEDLFSIVGVFVVAVSGLAILVYNCYLVATTGQSIAKRILGMRIIKSESGLPPGFVHGVLLRMLVPIVISQLCGLFGLVDALLIFGDQRRCIHDLIASTDVIEV